MPNSCDQFVSYDGLGHRDLYIFCDTNASYASIHQYLEGGFGQPCVVANGDAKGAGSCLAISYEARGKGIKRGTSILGAKSIFRDLVVYESCLPLYDIYSQLYDMILEWIVPSEFTYRGSCDEVIVCFRPSHFGFSSLRNFWINAKDFIEEKTKCRISMKLSPEQKEHLRGLADPIALIFGVAMMIRVAMKSLLGLPISIGIAPSVSLSKALIDHAKPIWSPTGNIYKTVQDGICFPQSVQEANGILRKRALKDICGVSKVARRVMESGLRTVADVQDQCDLERAIRLAKNKHLGEVLWYSCYGRDDVLPAYLSSIKYRK